MRNTIRIAFGAALALAAAALCTLPTAPTALSAGESTGVTKVRLGSLRRDDLVVVDVTGVPGGGGTGGVDTNAVRDIVREELGDLRPDDIGAMPSDYEAPVSSVNGKTGVVELTALDIKGALSTNDVEFLIGRHYETNTSLRIGGVEAHVGSMEGQLDELAEWQHTNALTRAAVETGFTDWVVSFSDPSISTADPPYGAVVDRVLASGYPTGYWSIFSPTDTVHSSETALAPLRPAPDDVTLLSWAAAETSWGGAVTARRVRVPTAAGLDAKAGTNDLRDVATGLGSRVDVLAAVVDEVQSSLSGIASGKADAVVVQYELDPPHMGAEDVWVVGMDGTALRFAGEDADGFRVWCGTNENNSAWVYEDSGVYAPTTVVYRLEELVGSSGSLVSGFTVHDAVTGHLCGLRTVQFGGDVIVYPPSAVPVGGFRESDLQYTYDSTATPAYSRVLLSYIPGGTSAATNVTSLDRGRRRRVEARIVYGTELDKVASGIRDGFVSRRAVETGFTEWAVESDRPLGEDVVPGMVEGGYVGLWSLFPADSTDRSTSAALTTTFVGGGASATTLSWGAAATKWGVAVRATRTRVPGMKDLQTIENTASSRWDTVSTYLPWLEDYATNNYAAAKFANKRAKDIEAWQYTNSVSRTDAEAGFTAWAVTPMWPLGRVVVAKVEDQLNLWGLFRPYAPDRRAASALLNVFHHDTGEPTNLVWSSVSVPVAAKWTNELAKAGFDWAGPFDDGNVTSSFRVVARRTRIPCMRDLREIENTASSRWETVSTYIPWLEDYATNNYTAAALANRRAKDLEAWQYTNAITRADIERGITDWAVTPMWPLGRVVVGQVTNGVDEGKWTLFRRGSSTPMPELAPQASVDNPVTNLVWTNVQLAVDARWTNELTSAGIHWDGLAAVGGRTNVTARFDVVARRTVIRAGSGQPDSPASQPYDALVEYIESTGVEYIDTGLVLDANTEFELYADPLESGSVYVVGNAVEPGETYGWGVAFHSSAVIMDWGFASSRIAGPPSNFTHSYRARMKCMSNTLSFVLEDITAGTTNTYARSGDFNLHLPTRHMFVFQDPSATTGARGRMRLRGLRIWQGGVLVRDYVPARVGTVGYLYDRVAQRMCANEATTGEFGIGSDVSDSSSAVRWATTLDLAEKADKPRIRALFIGNSLSQDQVTYLPHLLKRTYGDSVNFEISIFYLPSYTLTRYASEAEAGTLPAALIYSVAKNTDVWVNRQSTATLEQVLAAREYDIISVQGYFGELAPATEDVASALPRFADWIRRTYGKPFSLAYLAHPAYGAPYGSVPVSRLVAEGVAAAVASGPVEIVFPCGQAVENAKEFMSTEQLSFDHLHSDEGLPCYIGAYVVLSRLCERYGLPNLVYGNTVRAAQSDVTALSIPGTNGSVTEFSDEIYGRCQAAALAALAAPGETLTNYATRAELATKLGPYPFAEPTFAQTGKWEFSGTEAPSGYHWEVRVADPVDGGLYLYAVPDGTSDVSGIAPTQFEDPGNAPLDAISVRFLNGVTATRSYVCTLAPFKNNQVEMGWEFVGYMADEFECSMSFESGEWVIAYLIHGSVVETETKEGSEGDLVVNFDDGTTATRLPPAFTVSVSASTVTNTMRDLWFVVKAGNTAPTITWGTEFDRFDGGSAAAIAPTANAMNVYHIVEYGIGSFCVMKQGVAAPQVQSAKRYPLFIIDLNPDGSNNWSHIELKATTNNYATSDGMTFFCGSTYNMTSDDDVAGVPYHDWCRLYSMGSFLDSDVRRWVAVSNTFFMASEGFSPSSLMVIVDPALMRRDASMAGGSSWLSEDNEEITWSYVRIGGVDAEKDPSGKQLWRAVMPVRWYRELPAWARQTPVGSVRH